jgi:hypothetical protein
MTTVMERRVAAAQKTVDRFKDQPFQWGRFDCFQLVAFHCRVAGRPLKAAPKIGRYASLLTGVKRLRKLGYHDIPALLDGVFERIAPAAALAGDIIQMPSEDDDVGGVTVCVGNGRVIGYHEDVVGACILQPLEMKAAWRVL